MKVRGLHLALLVVILLSFALRVAFAWRSHPHVDEYSTIWAAMQVTRTGAPVLPSGFLYLQGVLFTYVDAAFIGLAGFSETVARAPAVLAGVVAIALTYVWGRRVLGPWAGLLAATLTALETESVVWSGRARMYSLQQALVVLTLYSLYRGFLECPGERTGRWRWLFAASFGGAILAQVSTVLFVPGVVLALLFLQRHRLRDSTGWPALVVAAGFVVVALGLNHLGGPVADASGRAFFDPALPWREKPGFFFYEFFWNWPDWLRTVPCLLGAAWVAAGMNRDSRVSQGSRATAALALLVFGTLLPMIFLVGETWQRPRYLVPLLPVMNLLAAAVLAQIGRNLGFTGARRGGSIAGAVVWTGVLLAFLPPAIASIGPAEPAYDEAYRYVMEHRQPEDASLSPLPSISATYLGRNDGYLLQNGYQEYVIESASGPVDRWTGSPLIRYADEIEQRFGPGQTLWFVVDDVRWQQRYDDAFRDYVLNNMRTAFRAEGVTVYERGAGGS